MMQRAKNVAGQQRRAATALCALLLAAPMLAMGNTADHPAEKAEPAPTLAQLRTFADVFNIVRKHYVDATPSKQLLDAALLGMLEELDDYSAFVPAAERAAVTAPQGPKPGSPAGSIGVQVQVRKQRLVISKVFTHGAAYRAGVRSGDLILAINGVPVRGRSLAASIDALGGRPGSEVALRLRSGQLPPRSVTLVRGVPLTASVSSRLLPAQVAYLRVNHFHAGTGEEFGEQLASLQREADGHLQGIVMDLRDNPGGVVRGATRLADGFLDAGLVVYTRGRYPSSQFEYHAEPGQWAPDVPTAVLINGSSASAAEIVAGALQDHGRAQLIGSNSFGKGTVQSSMYLEDGSLLRLTTARYFTPSGRQIEGTGVAPDIEVEASKGADGQDAELARALALLAGRQPAKDDR